MHTFETKIQELKTSVLTEVARLAWEDRLQAGILDEETRRELATFQLRVLFRQNASWQGSLIWVDQRMDAQFRSVLELVRLMDSALTMKEECTV